MASWSRAWPRARISWSVERHGPSPPFPAPGGAFCQYRPENPGAALRGLWKKFTKFAGIGKQDAQKNTCPGAGVLFFPRRLRLLGTRGFHCAACLGCPPSAVHSTLRSVRSLFRDVHAAAEQGLYFFAAAAANSARPFAHSSSFSTAMKASVGSLHGSQRPASFSALFLLLPAASFSGLMSPP